MFKIFLSYRREDSHTSTQAIYTRLAGRFGASNVYLDEQSTPYGQDFPPYIADILRQCAVQLVIIGPHYLDVANVKGRRIDDPEDLVRIEVEIGLARGIAIPVLVDGATIAHLEGLPQSLRPLLTRNAIFVSSDPGADQAFGRLMAEIAARIPPTPQSPGWERVMTRKMAQLNFTYLPNDAIDLILPPVRPVAASPCTIGSLSAESEKPIHTMTVAEFSMATFPVTVAEFACFVRATSPSVGSTAEWQNQALRREHPVVYISWDDATAYAEWLSYQTKQCWRLPTEIEWEKATAWEPVRNVARPYPWGTSFDASYCNTEEGGKQGTAAVGAYPKGSSAYGIQDLSGNVWEWTSSAFLPYPYTAADGREKRNERLTRSKRGGSWNTYASSARASKRIGERPELRSADTGFRLVLGAV